MQLRWWLVMLIAQCHRCLEELMMIRLRMLLGRKASTVWWRQRSCSPSLFYSFWNLYLVSYLRYIFFVKKKQKCFLFRWSLWKPWRRTTMWGNHTKMLGMLWLMLTEMMIICFFFSMTVRSCNANRRQLVKAVQI